MQEYSKFLQQLLQSATFPAFVRPRQRHCRPLMCGALVEESCPFVPSKHVFSIIFKDERMNEYALL